MADSKKQPQKKKPIKSDKKKSSKDVNSKAVEDVYFKQIFETYVLWKTLPPMLLNFSVKNKKLSDEETCAHFGLDDAMTRELIGIKTQKQFAEHYNVSQDVLGDWNKRIDTRDMLADSRKWAKKLTKNVVLMLYQGAIGKGGMSFKDREMFFKVINHWNEKQSLELDVGPSLFEILKKGNHDRRIRK